MRILGSEISSRRPQTRRADGAPLVVLVTGASSGIGRATALRFARDHARLILLARSAESLEAAAMECMDAGATLADVEPCDVNDLAALVDIARDADTRYDGIDVVVHAAAVAAYGAVEDLPPGIYRQVVDTILHGTANLARAVLPGFRQRQRGELIVVSSLLAEIAAPKMGAYVSGKWGQLGLVRVLQLETRDMPGIRISAVAPGGVDTPIYHQAANIVGREGRPPPPAYTSERVARAIVAQVGRSRRVVQSGFLNPLVVLGFRLVPGLYDRLVGPLLSSLGLEGDPAPETTGNVFAPRPEAESTHSRA
jgi:short-subunit dehydrogenase